ncbi:MAG: DUF4845 domain-containing protein [Gammaproteobacteria bacterium]|nr:MAG: DUF4845 domain-containing protein [Gammaproteobacteria bacterium]
MRSRQAGLSMWSLMFYMLIGASLITVGVKIVPIYIDHFAIRSALKELAQERDLNELSPGDIMSRFEKRLSINNIRDFDPKHVKIRQEDGKVLIDVNYEVRTHIVKNIDAVLTFKEHFDSSQK